MYKRIKSKMPRTKAPAALSQKAEENKKPTANELHEHTVESYLKAIKAAELKWDKEMEIEKERTMLKHHIALHEELLKFPHNRCAKTLAELKIEKPENATICEISSFKNVTASTTGNWNITQNGNTTRNGNTSRHPKESKDMSMRPRKQSIIKKAKVTRTSRSLSRSKVQAFNSLTTPIGQKITNTAFALVTPKVKPNTPQVVLRRPKQGEMAISMQGSPLMVSGMATESRANVNIPLPDGRVLSIQPQRGLRSSQIPDMDEETKRQIETLRDNLNKVCALSSRD